METHHVTNPHCTHTYNMHLCTPNRTISQSMQWRTLVLFFFSHLQSLEIIAFCQHGWHLPSREWMCYVIERTHTGSHAPNHALERTRFLSIYVSHVSVCRGPRGRTVGVFRRPSHSAASHDRELSQLTHTHTLLNYCRLCVWRCVCVCVRWWWFGGGEGGAARELLL